MVIFGGDCRWILLALDRVKKAVVGFVQDSQSRDWGSNLTWNII